MSTTIKLMMMTISVQVPCLNVAQKDATAQHRKHQQFDFNIKEKGEEKEAKKKHDNFLF